ncbi:MAG: O-acetylserine sulfhydrylase [Bacteroidetes bacterium ADurb.Bin408]|nr:MAG: O-acetylserine sulfhydrylase [Bacteroidetes bacterium ADurb.Bin408]
MPLISNMLGLIGRTPMVKLNKLTHQLQAHVFVKLENFNPMSSVKDRAALAMIEDAEKRKLINRDTLIIEPTSGNTGISLAFVCAVKGYKLKLVMPESMSVERRQIIASLGAELVLTPASEGMQGAVNKAQQLAACEKNCYIPLQFSNKANPKTHYSTTAQEIWEQTEGSIDIFVAGVGTGGTLSGVSKALKMKNNELWAVAVEPASSPVISGGKAAPHKIQGIGAGFIPENLNVKLIDEIVQVKNEDAINTARRLIREEGIFCGISSGANVFAALQLAQRADNKGKIIVTIICDTAERYLSTELFNKTKFNK